MTINEAIKELEHTKEIGSRRRDEDMIMSAQLGIEALKVFMKAREQGQLSPNELLRGETKS